MLPHPPNFADVGADAFWQYVSSLNNYAFKTAPGEIANARIVFMNNLLAVQTHQIEVLIASLITAESRNLEKQTTQNAMLAEEKARNVALEMKIAQQNRRITAQSAQLHDQSVLLGAKMAKENRAKKNKTARKNLRGEVKRQRMTITVEV